MHSSIKAGIALSMALLSSACVPWARERPAYADLCRSEFEFTVPAPEGQTTVHLYAYLYDHAARWSDEPFQQGLHVDYPGERYARPEFYVQLIGYNQDRARANRSGRGAAPIPMLLDSRQAFITFEAGSRLKARPDVYVSDNEVYDYPRVHPKLARPSPYDINSDEVHRHIPRITNDKRYGSAYVIFQTDQFKAESKWTIHLGTLQVQEQTLQMPTLELCYHPVKKWIGIEPLMRP